MTQRFKNYLQENGLRIPTDIYLALQQSARSTTLKLNIESRSKMNCIGNILPKLKYGIKLVLFRSILIFVKTTGSTSIHYTLINAEFFPLNQIKTKIKILLKYFHESGIKGIGEKTVEKMFKYSKSIYKQTHNPENFDRSSIQRHAEDELETIFRKYHKGLNTWKEHLKLYTTIRIFLKY